MAPVPLRDELVARNHGDRVAHMVTRGAFMRHFLDWERTEDLQRHWAEKLGFVPSIERLAAALDELATAAGYPDRSSLATALRDEDTLEVIRGPENDEVVLQEVQNAWIAANLEAGPYNMALDALLTSASSMLFPEAQDFVCSLGLPWPWLAIELVENFGYACTAKPYGLALVKNFNLEPSPAIVTRPVTLQVNLEPGQNIDQALEQLRREHASAVAAVKSQQMPLGRVPKKLRESYVRFADWFFRNHVLGQSYRRIAQDAFSDAPRPEDRKKDVTTGIARAKYFLELAAFRYRPGVDGTYANSPRGEFLKLTKPL